MSKMTLNDRVNREKTIRDG